MNKNMSENNSQNPSTESPAESNALILSPTQIMSYTRCPESFRRRYIEKEIIPPAIAQVKGTAVHKGAEFNYSQKIETKKDLPKKDIVDYSVNAYENQIKSEGVFLDPEEEMRGKKIVISEGKDQTVKIADEFASAIASKYQPESVEEEIKTVLPIKNIAIKGIIDLKTDNGFIVDLKVSGKAWTQDKVNRSVQLTFYSLLNFAKEGKYPSKLIIENIVEAKKIKTLTLETTRSRNDYETLLTRISSVVEGIQKGCFPPTSETSYWCDFRYCGYWKTCKYVN